VSIAHTIGNIVVILYEITLVS